MLCCFVYDLEFYFFVRFPLLNLYLIFHSSVLCLNCEFFFFFFSRLVCILCFISVILSLDYDFILYCSLLLIFNLAVHKTIVLLFKWLLFNANSANFQLYHGENKLIFNVMMRSALYSTNMLNWILIVLAHRNNNSQIDMSPYLDTFFWFRTNQSLLFLLDVACLAEKQATFTNFIVFGLNQSGLEPTIYHTWGKRGNHYTTDVVLLLVRLGYFVSIFFMWATNVTFNLWKGYFLKWNLYV